MVGGLQLVDLALRRFRLDPPEEAGDRRAVAILRRLLPGDLDGVLDRLRKDGRISERDDIRASLVERLEDCRHSPLWIYCDRLSLQLAERSFERIAVVQPNAVAEVLLHLRADLLRIHKH